MKISLLTGHNLQDTLNEIERLSSVYFQDLKPFETMKIKEFFNFVSKKIKYKQDPPGAELVMRPVITIKRGSGDCDDKTVLCLAFLKLKNIPCGYSIVSQKVDMDFHHIFPFIALGNGKKIDFDATYADNKIGAERHVWKKRKDFIFYEG